MHAEFQVSTMIGVRCRGGGLKWGASSSNVRNCVGLARQGSQRLFVTWLFIRSCLNMYSLSLIGSANDLGRQL